MLNRALARRLIATLILIAPAVGQTPTFYPPSVTEQPPRDPNFNNQGTSTRNLTSNESNALCRMLDAAAHYVTLHPEYAPQLSAMRDVKDKGRFKRNPGKSNGYRTLPDWVSTTGGHGKFKPPGAKMPSGGGGYLPPNTVLVGDNELDGEGWSDPANGCYNRIRAIVAIVHEGFRQLNHGNIEAGNPDCGLLRNAVATYVADIAILGDAIANGVPVPGATNCILAGDDLANAEAQMADSKKKKKAACDEMTKKGCSLPPECT